MTIIFIFRVRSSRTDKNYPTDKQNGAFSVLTLTLEVTFSDRGPFVCVVEHQTPGGVMYHNKTITVDVAASSRFEFNYEKITFKDVTMVGNRAIKM